MTLPGLPPNQNRDGLLGTVGWREVIFALVVAFLVGVVLALLVGVGLVLFGLLGDMLGG